TAITDVHEAQARYDQAVASEIEAQRLYDISLESLRELTGKMPVNLAKLNEQQELMAPNPNDIDVWVKTALDKNLLLLSAQKGVEAAMEGRDLASAGHYPTLDLQADYTNYDTESGVGGTPYEQDGTSVSLVLNIPIYSGGGTSASAREAAANLQRSKELYEQQRRATIRQVRNSYLTVLSAISQAQALKQALRSTQTALEATQAGFEVGTRTTVDVLDSQRELYRAERDYIRARHGYILSTLVLKQAAGTLTDDDVRLINAWLQ
ncbi:MAG: TolC family outer membrane protein, partial [Thioalkalispiraceae bacterium]